MSILVIDVGTSGLRAAIVRPDATVSEVQYRAMPPSTPLPPGVNTGPHHGCSSSQFTASCMDASLPAATRRAPQ